MPSQGARVAVLWHMHQPYYRDPVSGRSSLPWVRLHAVKDYHPMAVLLERFPGVRCTVNFVPSLLKQVREYTDEGLRDDFWDASVPPAADLSSAQRVFILRSFFMANWNLSVRPHRRYLELLEKRGFAPDERDLERAASLFSVRDMLDLQVWFNLVWFHPLHLEEDPELRRLAGRGAGFTEEDKGYVLARQLALMAEVIPAWRRLSERGQVELSTSPFYHPILPLLVRQESAHEAMPGLELPSPSFSRPDDAALQLARAVDYHREVFGRAPEGLWPSEGSVSEDIVPLVMDAGFRWMASDEDILYRSRDPRTSGAPSDERQRCRILYRPYLLERGQRTLSMVFRDHLLSDAVGFTYGHWNPADAAADLVGRIEAAAAACDGGKPGPLVSVILDGENPWEYYREQGYPFLRELYGRLESSAAIRPVTVGEGVAAGPPGERLHRLFAGSWINHNFQIWIGHAEDRRAWELLARARRAVDDMPADTVPGGPRDRALEELLIAEGSDWCWWYGEENSSGNDEAFDELFRRHLANVYALAGRRAPDDLKVSIFSGKRFVVPITPIWSFIRPTIDGRVTSYFEWLAAGVYVVSHQGSTMHRAECVVSGIYFGFDPATLYLRVDPAMEIMANEPGHYTFGIHVLHPAAVRLEVTAHSGHPPGVALRRGESGEAVPAEGVQAALVDVLEVSVPFALLGAETGDEVAFFVSLAKDGRELGHWPHQGYLGFPVPPPDFEEKIWST